MHLLPTSLFNCVGSHLMLDGTLASSSCETRESQTLIVQVLVLFNYLLMAAVKADGEFFLRHCGVTLALEGPVVFSFDCEERFEKPVAVISSSINKSIDIGLLAFLNITSTIYNRTPSSQTPIGFLSAAAVSSCWFNIWFKKRRKGPHVVPLQRKHGGARLPLTPESKRHCED